jgi:hypothetical protein
MAFTSIVFPDPLFLIQTPDEKDEYRFHCNRTLLLSVGDKIKKFWEELISYFPSYETGHIENDASNNSSIVVCIRYRGNVSLPSSNREIFTEPLPSNDKEIFTEPLPSNDRGLHIQTLRLVGGIFV